MDFITSAAALYDGGWRSSDREQMIEEYDLTEEEADGLCAALADLEAEEAEEDLEEEEDPEEEEEDE